MATNKIEHYEPAVISLLAASFTGLWIREYTRINYRSTLI